MEGNAAQTLEHTDAHAHAHAPYAMRQRRICEYLGLPCTHLRSFLCLPSSLRHRIYCEAGLIKDEEVNLNRHRLPDIADSWPSSDDFHISYSLLLTCRTIYAEVSSIIYSTSRFFIRYRDSRNLQPLLNLRVPTLSSLTHLTVHLNVTSCEIDQPCWRVYHEIQNCRHKHDKPFKTSSRQHQAILSEWQSAASYITAHIESSRLKLYFLCDVVDLEAARRAVEPFLSSPTLRDCSIRLGQQPDSTLQDMARQTATRAVGYHFIQPMSPFRFLDLPQELRRQILEYTDLVTPLCEVEWNPEKGFYVRFSFWRCGGIWDCPPQFHHSCQFRNCWDYPNVHCFCRRYHSAYSSKCNCWSPPTSLFLACHALREDAQAIFFMKNRFVITPSKGSNSVADGTPTRLEVSIFLTKIVPPDVLGFLTFLEVVFPPFDEDYLRPNEPAYQDWLQTIDYVKDKLYLPTLTLRVYMADHVPSGPGVTPFRNNITKQQGMVVLAMYVRTLGPLSKLNRMKRFFVHLAWPFAWTRSARRARTENREFMKQQAATMEQRVERLVMGNDYNSMLLEKDKQGHSQWLEASLVTFM